MHLLCSISKLLHLELELNTWPKQLLGSLPLAFPLPAQSLKETADSPQASKAIADVYFKKAALGTHTFTGLAPIAVLSKMINMFAK